LCLKITNANVQTPKKAEESSVFVPAYWQPEISLEPGVWDLEFKFPNDLGMKNPDDGPGTPKP